ncbi:SIP domain-containing protein [Streptomyces halstedii]|uniref:SIP domain-containing protein n=1 Tax=Streptomyces halstedii TaxID=1944 RepID=UPI0038216567
MTPGEDRGPARVAAPALDVSAPAGRGASRGAPGRDASRGRRTSRTAARHPQPPGTPYAWITGEATGVRAPRRHLVQERGIGRKRVTRRPPAARPQRATAEGEGEQSGRVRPMTTADTKQYRLQPNRSVGYAEPHGWQNPPHGGHHHA